MIQRCFDTAWRLGEICAHTDSPTQTAGTGSHTPLEDALPTSPEESGNCVTTFTAQGLALPSTAYLLQELKRKGKPATAPQRGFPAFTGEEPKQT